LIGTSIFAHLTAESPHTLQWDPIPSQKFPLNMERSGPPSKTGYMGLWAHPSPYPNRHLDRFGRLCRAYDCDRQTDRQTDHATQICNNRPHLHGTV